MPVVGRREGAPQLLGNCCQCWALDLRDCKLLDENLRAGMSREGRPHGPTLAVFMLFLISGQWSSEHGGGLAFVAAQRPEAAPVDFAPCSSENDPFGKLVQQATLLTDKGKLSAPRRMKNYTFAADWKVR